MSYQALARKWRPRTFQAMVGQQHVLQALINSLDQNRLHHAYLFTGTRGVGKTTIARILAKCLNCEQGVSSTPCEICSACKAINEGRFIDLIEVDAASRTKVEDTRELLDNVQYMPTQGRYKVYLIDEVHMLSGHSFNALLKTLEEPPEHVKFLLATTDPQKLPATVLSRCLQFHLKNLVPEQISDHLAKLLQQENIAFEPTALKQLARAAQGSLRDGLSLLDQAISFCNGEVTTAQVSTMLGTIDHSLTFAILQALINRDTPSIFAQIQSLALVGIDFHTALEDLLSLLHQLAVLQAVPAATNEELENREALLTLSQSITAEDLQLFYQIGLIGRRDLPLAPSAKVGFEMVLLRMLAFQPAQPAKTPPLSTPIATPITLTKPQPMPSIKNNKASAASEAITLPIKASVQNWADLIKQLNLSGISQLLAQNCVLQSQTENQIELVLSPQQAPLLNDNAKQRITDALRQHFGNSIQLTIRLGDSQQTSPAAQAATKASILQQAAERAVLADPNIQSLLSQFDGIIAPGSVKPMSTTSEEV